MGICHDASDETVDIVRPPTVPIEVLMDFSRLLFHVRCVNALYKDFIRFSTFPGHACIHSLLCYP